MPGVIGMKTSKMRELPKWRHDWLTHIDARSKLGYALKQRLQALEHDVGAGQPDRLTYAQRSLIRRALWLEVRLETDEVKIVTGDPIPAGSHSTLLNALTAVYRTLGVEPKARPVKSLQDYIDEQEAS